MGRLHPSLIILFIHNQIRFNKWLLCAYINNMPSFNDDNRLFYIVRPTRAYFGEKDWQQIAVIKCLVKYLGIDIQIVECEIVREKDGLARSSRNTLLSEEERAITPHIYKALKSSVTYSKKHTVEETHDKVVKDINAVECLEVEYCSIVDGDTLQDVGSWDDSEYIVGCITVYCGKTPIRLIDHIKIGRAHV